MKKISKLLLILLIAIIIFIIVDNNVFIKKLEKKNENNTSEIKKNENEKDLEEEIKKEDTIVDDDKITIGLYKNYRDGTKRKLITDYSSEWKFHNDISSFEVYYTNEAEITNDKQIRTFDMYKEKYEKIDDYKIGYAINFKTINEEINKTILTPKDTEEFFNYLEIYLYDDYHRSGGWYSHTTESEFNDNTLLTSIKLTAGKNINDITSDIILTAFVYKENDIKDNIYIGNNKYSINVKRAS